MYNAPFPHKYDQKRVTTDTFKFIIMNLHVHFNT